MTFLLPPGIKGLRCRPFLPRYTSLMLTLSIQSTSNWPKYLLKLDKVRNVFVMYCFRRSNSSKFCLDIFKTALSVPICSITCSGFFLSKGTRWCFRSSIVAPLKSRTFTTWLFLESRFSSIPVSIETPAIKQVPLDHACLKLPGVSLLSLIFFSLLLCSEHFCFR